MAQDRAEGAFIGACIGDSAGALLEIPIRDAVEPEEVERALSLQGGGAHRLGPGQITDDCEMAMALAHALTGSQPPQFPVEEVAMHYGHWLDSRPFTVGRFCRKPCAEASNATQKKNIGSPAQRMATVAAKANSVAQGNGALMRIVPLAIWGNSMDDSELAHCAQQDAALTHPHMTCKACNAVFCIAVAHLIHQPGDVDAAISAAEEYAKFNAPQEVFAWLQEALALATTPSVTLAGSSEWVRWPFTLSFRHLKMRSSLETALRDTLSRGGATGTNATVVGAMIGALHGAAAISPSLKDPILSRGSLSKGNPKYPRPPWLHTRLIPSLCQQLLHASYAASAMELATPEKVSSR